LGSLLNTFKKNQIKTKKEQNQSNLVDQQEANKTPRLSKFSSLEKRFWSYWRGFL